MQIHHGTVSLPLKKLEMFPGRDLGQNGMLTIAAAKTQIMRHLACHSGYIKH